MPIENALARARKDKREGKSASTQAGEFVREEIKRLGKGRHAAKTAAQAIAIGLSEARHAGIEIAAKDVPAKTRARKTAVKKAVGKRVASRAAGATRAARTRAMRARTR